MNKKTSLKQTPEQKAVHDLAAAVAGKDATATLVLAWKNAPPFYDLRLPQLDAKPQQWFLSRAREQAKVMRDKRSILDYDPEYTPKTHEALYMGDLDPLPGGSLFDDLADYANITALDSDQLKRPTMYVLVVVTKKGTAYFGKRMTGLHVLSGTRTRRMLYTDGRFSDMAESVATFSDRFDWVVWDDAFIIDNVGTFHQEFRDNAELQQAVEDSATAIHSVLPIVGFDAFVERCQRVPSMASKLTRAETHGLYKKPVKELKDYAKTHQINVKWKGKKLVFDGSSVEGGRS